jgi:4-methylaminobutanoate oxidase (formaldehyde-forming)
VPLLEKVGVKQLLNGPESFTPDGNFILGRAPECSNFFVGAGFNAFGIASGGGAGMALAEWVASGHPPYDLSVVDILRFGKHHESIDWVRDRTLESYSRHYTIAWPNEEWNSTRCTKKSPLYDRLKDQGAVFGEKLGWERPNWFAGPHDEPFDIYSMTKANWFGAVGSEHKAVRETAGLFDQSSFGKFLLTGFDASQLLGAISASRIPNVNCLNYSLLLNDAGGVVSDLVIARLDENTFYIVASTGWASKDFDWIKSSISSDDDVELVDITSEKAVLSLMGPNSRAILSNAMDGELHEQSLSFGTVSKITIAGVSILALRVTFVGEMGWELHIPADKAGQIYETLMKVGSSLGLVNAGYRAIESLRLEKGYLAYGSDISRDHNPFELGLRHAIRLDVNRDYRGKEALLKAKNAKLVKRMTRFSIDDQETVLLGRETIIRNGQPVGWLSSAGYGYSVGKWIGLGLVRNENGVDEDYIKSGRYELEVAGRRYSCSLF